MAKYKPYPQPNMEQRFWPDKKIEQAPRWCSVDLRDGNQALAIPMSIGKKLAMFDLLLDIGFKEIEVGFPSASKIDFDFTRRLIEEGRVPSDTAIQVLTQAREDLISRTVESVKGADRAVIHLYNSTSTLQRKITFRMSMDEVKDLAVKGAKLVKKYVQELKGTDVMLQYSPESFSDTETDFALEVCEAVMDVWEPDADNPVILNLPETVQYGTPNVYADQIEWFITHMKNPEAAVISLHTHNDRGTGVASSELGMLAGAARVEGTLFGNGERTGNVDLVTVALNLFSHGIETGLDFSDLPKVRRIYEDCTGMDVPPRHPYAGDLVFTAFSGSHQDAIKKGMDRRKDLGENAPWEVPYLPVDPRDVGRNYEAIIRINSQSGKGGVAYVLSREYGYELPKGMHRELGKAVNDLSDELGREIAADEILSLFRKEFLQLDYPLRIVHFHTEQDSEGDGKTLWRGKMNLKNREFETQGRGNGPIDAFAEAIEQAGITGFSIMDFHEQSLGTGSGTEAVAYVEIESAEGEKTWGTGVDTNIGNAGIKAFLSAINRAYRKVPFTVSK
jgi:2-isopropylmalate synthase